MQSAKPYEGVLELGVLTLWLGSKLARGHVEEFQDRKKLLGREGAGSSLDFAQTTLGEAEPTRELRLGPMPLLSELLDF